MLVINTAILEKEPTAELLCKISLEVMGREWALQNKDLLGCCYQKETYALP